CEIFAQRCGFNHFTDSLFFSTATSVILHNAVSVQVGSVSSYNCSVTGSGPDPQSVVWEIKDTSGTTISNAGLFTTQLFDTANSADGSVISQATFTVVQSHLGKRLFCTVNDQGTSSTMSIYTVITATNQANLGQTCSAAISCSPANSRCSNNICVCSTGYTVNGNTCNQKKQLGSSCPVGNSQACAPSDSQCSSFQPYVCECQNGYVQSGSTCVLSQAGLGESCTNPSRTCSVSDSACTFGTCQCSNGFVSSGSTCITSTVNLGDSCVNPTLTCSVPNSSCGVSGTCTCSQGYTQSGSTCVSNSAVAGQACVSSVGCGATGSSVNPSCVNNICECPNNYYTFNAECKTSPANTQNPFTVNGASNFPSTYVGATCYEVNLHESTQMVCEDAKGQPLSAAGWYHMPSFTAVSISTGGFINGDISNTDLTVSNALSNYTGDYMCRLCYSSSRDPVFDPVCFTIGNNHERKHSDAHLQHKPHRRGINIHFLQGLNSHPVDHTIHIPDTERPDDTYRLLPITQTVTHNFDDGDLVITCSGFSANPAISAYTFYNEAGSQLASSASASYTVNSTQGYQIYYCRATNSLGTSNEQYIDVQEPGTEPGVGASTENTGLGTGTIAAIVLGIIFLLLLIIIIIVCCCSYGWCRKKEKVEPEIHIVSQPPVKPYIPSVSTEEYEPYVASPRYYLKPATSTGPIISMFDDSYEQPRAHQLPALDTQYLYSDDHKPRHKKKRRKHRRSHREPSPRRDVYAEVTPPSDEDLVVVPGKQNYMEADA
ncbi:hypothetical protein MAR_020699, partial [Mya arenaria]